MTQKLILYISLVALFSVCLFVYVQIHAPADIKTMNDTGEPPTFVQDTEGENPTDNNPVITPQGQDLETKIISSATQTPPTMHSEQFTLTQNETVHTNDNLVSLTLAGITIEQNEPDPNLPYSPDPGIMCPSFLLRIHGVEETLSLCIATQGDTPNRNTGSVQSADGTVTLSVLDMSGATSSFGHPEKIVVQITY